MICLCVVLFVNQKTAYGVRISDWSSDVCSSDLDGLADNIRTMGIAVFGPGRDAARLEGSKGFTKELCAREGIPTARFERVYSRDGARAALDDFALPVVIKADGLAAGKEIGRAHV